MSREQGFTLIELLVVVAIIAILAAILFPVFERARQKALSASCQSNLKQHGLAFRMYAEDYDGYFPHADYSITPAEWPIDGWVMNYSSFATSGAWQFFLWPYVKNRDVFQCPVGSVHNAWEGYKYGSYTWNWTGTRMKTLGARGQIEEPSETFLVFDGARYRVLDSPSTSNPLADIKNCIGYDRTDSSRGHRHNDMLNVTFCDGHVKALNKNAMVEGVPSSNTGVTEAPWNIRW